MPRTPHFPRSEPPTLTPQHAIELLHGQLNKFEDKLKLHRTDPEVQKWENTTKAIMNAAFGKPNGQLHKMTTEFKYTGGGLEMNRSDAYYQKLYQESMFRKTAALAGC